ncbi:MAG: hypothetical protein WC301_04295 [Candidatus Omnitrophota bacterium]|jgi:septal ring factor EnvC (AmiA/AmiB activator)
MPDKAKMPLIVMALLIVASLSLAGSGFYLLQKEKAKNSMLQDQLQGLKMEQEAAEAKLAQYTKTISQLEVNLKDAQSEVYELTDTLEKQAKEKDEALGRLQRLNQELNQQKELRAELEKSLQQAQSDTKEVVEQLKEIGSKRVVLEARIKELEAQLKQTQANAQPQGVELGTIVVASEDNMGAAKKVEPPADTTKRQPKAQPSKQAPIQPKEQAATPSSEGKVLVVNKEYDFIVVNLGSRNGVKPGDIFAIYRGNKYLGDIKVAKTHDSMSAADFLTPAIKNSVREGDRIVQKDK